MYRGNTRCVHLSNWTFLDNRHSLNISFRGEKSISILDGQEIETSIVNQRSLIAHSLIFYILGFQSLETWCIQSTLFIAEQNYAMDIAFTIAGLLAMHNVIRVFALQVLWDASRLVIDVKLLWKYAEREFFVRWEKLGSSKVYGTFPTRWSITLIPWDIRPLPTRVLNTYTVFFWSSPLWCYTSLVRSLWEIPRHSQRVFHTSELYHNRGVRSSV